jgi:hypothetical protein
MYKLCVCIYVIRCINSMYIYMLLAVLDANCVFYKLNAYCIFYPAMTDKLTSALEATIVSGVLQPIAIVATHISAPCTTFDILATTHLHCTPSSLSTVCHLSPSHVPTHDTLSFTSAGRELVLQFERSRYGCVRLPRASAWRGSTRKMRQLSASFCAFRVLDRCPCPASICVLCTRAGQNCLFANGAGCIVCR